MRKLTEDAIKMVEDEIEKLGREIDDKHKVIQYLETIGNKDEYVDNVDWKMVCAIPMNAYDLTEKLVLTSIPKATRVNAGLYEISFMLHGFLCNVKRDDQRVSILVNVLRKSLNVGDEVEYLKHEKVLVEKVLPELRKHFKDIGPTSHCEIKRKLDKKRVDDLFKDEGT